MNRFPSEFADLLSPRGRRWLSAGSASLSPQERLRHLQGVIPAATASAVTELLDRRLASTMTPLSTPIPPESITRMKRNYSERLGKVMRLQTANFYRRDTRSSRLADRLGLLRMMRSKSFGAFARAVSGLPLADDWDLQVLSYEHGDYVGPHNDHHPEIPEARRGFVDFHVTFCNRAVAHQWLVYENRRHHLAEVLDATASGSVSVYLLPFWHYTTPLQGRRGQESAARRWLLLGSFMIEPGAWCGPGRGFVNRAQPGRPVH